MVRSSARRRPFHHSNAGSHESLLNVDPESGLEAAIEQVIASYGLAEDNDQVLIQPMVTNVTLGGVTTRTFEHGAPWYVVNYETNGNTEAITSGTSGDHRILLLRRGIESRNYRSQTAHWLPPCARSKRCCYTPWMWSLH